MMNRRVLTIGILVLLSLLTKSGDSSVLKSHAQLRKFCLIFALPGRRNGPNIPQFETVFASHQNKVGESIFGTGKTHVQRMQESENCSSLLTFEQYTAKCAYHRLSIIKSNFTEDLKRMETAVSANTDATYMFIVYLSTWFLDNVFLSLDCGPVSLTSLKPRAMMKYVAKWSNHITNRDKFCKWPTAIAKTTAVNLRETVRNNCMFRPTEPFCELKSYFEIADTMQAFCDLVPASNWNSNDEYFNHYRDAAIVTFFTKAHEATKYKAIYGNIDALFNNDTQDENVKGILSGVVYKMYDDFRQNNLTFVQKVMTVMPPSNRLPCDFTAQFPRFSWLLCTCAKVFRDIRLFMGTYVTKSVGPGETKTLYKDIDYMRTYITESRTSQILTLQQQYSYSLAGVVTDIKNNLQDRMKQLGQYFVKVAETETKKLTADVGFLKGKIGDYTNKIKEFGNSLGSKMGVLTGIYMGTAAADLAWAVAKMVVAMSTAVNPLAWLTKGGNIADIIGAAQDIAAGSRKITEAGRAIAGLDNLIKESRRISKLLEKNQGPLLSVYGLIENINADPMSNGTVFSDQQESFLTQYTDYSPAATASDLAGLEQYWNGFIDGVCDGIADMTGATAIAMRTAADYKTKCRDSKGIAARLVGCYAEIFDFQFELMDTMSQVMISLARIHETKELGKGPAAENLDGISDSELMSFMAVSGMSYKMQQTINMYLLCDLYEYWRGNQLPLCNGMATDLTKLVSAANPTCSGTYKYITIPTQLSASSTHNTATDFSFIDLGRLYRGELVPFQIPNSQWLVDHADILDSQKNYRYFVGGIHVFVPVPHAGTKRRGIEIVTIPTNDGNKLDPTEKTTYIIRDNVEVNGEKANPNMTLQYSESCEGALPEAMINNPYGRCGVNTRQVMENYCADTENFKKWTKTTRPMPSIYAKFYLKLSGFNDGIDAPNGIFNLRAGIKWCSVDSASLSSEVKRKKKQLSHEKLISKVTRTPLLNRRQTTCCSSESQYFYNQCNSCPRGTKSYFDNLFCGNVVKMITTLNEPYTYDAAVAACVSEKTTIASKALIDEAISLNQLNDNCGWIEGQQVCKLASTEECSGCDSTNTWNVWCATKYQR